MEILPFNFENREIRIFTDSENNIWFIVKDILEILEISTKHTSMTLRKLDEDELTTIKMLSGGQNRDMKAVSESGFYKLVLRSNKPVAKPFQKWVTRDVLPSIRKTGTYSIQKDNSNLPQLKERAEKIEISTNMFISFEKIFSRIGIVDKTELAITSNRAVQKETGIDFIELSEKRGLEISDKFLTPTELAELSQNPQFLTKSGKGSGRKMNLELEKYGFQFLKDKVWIQTESGKEFSKFVQNKSKYSEKNIFHLNWKKDVLEKLSVDKQKTFLEI